MQQTTLRRNPAPFGAMSDFGYREVLIIGADAGHRPGPPASAPQALRARNSLSLKVFDSGPADHRQRARRHRPAPAARARSRDFAAARPDPAISLPLVEAMGVGHAEAVRLCPITSWTLVHLGHAMFNRCSPADRMCCVRWYGPTIFFAHRWLATKCLHLSPICLPSSYSNVILPRSDGTASNMYTSVKFIGHIRTHLR